MNGEPIFILLVIFGSIFGIFYLYFTTRNRERLALIEKGAEAKIFARGNKGNPAPFWKVFILNLALLSMGVGLGILIAMILESVLEVYDEGPLYAGSVFLTAGLALFVGFTLTKKLDK